MSSLAIELWGFHFPNPIWTAAGPTAADAAILKEAKEGGAGGLVTKTLSVVPARVPIPNIVSPFTGSLLNAELWSEMEYPRFIERELPVIKALGLPVIVSVGYSPQDLSTLGAALEKSGLVDGVEFSIHYVDKNAENLQAMARALKDTLSVPVLAKLSPAVQDIVGVVKALEPYVDGFVAINSLGPALDFDIETLDPGLGSSDGRGWLSGRAILPIGLHYVATIAATTDKPVIGVGGIRDYKDVIKYIMAGASAVQVCSLAILRGQKVYGQLARGVGKWLTKHGYSHIYQIKGAFLKYQRDKEYYLAQGVQLYPHFTQPRCTYCDVCVRSCVHGAIHFEEKDFIVDHKLCVSCGLCASLCPTNALDMREG